MARSKRRNDIQFPIEAWFDGCCEPRNPGGHAAWGAVVIVHGTHGDAKIEMSGYCGVGPKMSNNVAEYTGATAALKEAIKYEGPILVRGDSKLVIMQLQRKWKVNGGLYHPFYLEAKAIYDANQSRIALEWVPRDENDVCDYLSKAELHNRGVQFKIQPERKL